ncbi:MAG: ribosome maturation factor RimM [Terriglobia bacterium]
MAEHPRISVARIARTQGNRGEVAADVLTDFPERFTRLRQVRLEKPGVPPLDHFLDSFWFHKNRVILKFRGIDSINEASQLVGYDVTVPETEKSSLPEGTYYQHDLIGCSLIGKSGNEYGEVIDVIQYGSNLLLKIKGSSKEFLVPFAEGYFSEINLQNRILRCDLPDGLEEL